MTTYNVEVTDTFGGEANYCWVHRYSVRASTFTGAIRKVARAEGWRFRCSGDFGDERQYDARGACVRAFVNDDPDRADDRAVSL